MNKPHYNKQGCRRGIRYRLDPLLLVLLMAGAAHGQLSSKSTLQGQLFFSTLRPTSGETKSLHLGGSFGVVLANGFGLAADLGHLYTPNKGTGILSILGSYHVPILEGLEGFAAAGYSRAFVGNAANLFPFGGGVTLWLNEHGGLRMEVRDSVSRNLWPTRTLHTSEYRVAVVFR